MGSKLDVYGDDFLRLLVGRQLRLSCSMGGILVAGLGAIPLADRYIPREMAVRVAGLPIAWWILGIVAFPLLVALAWAYVRRSTDVEDEVIGVVDVATLPGPPSRASGGSAGS